VLLGKFRRADQTLLLRIPTGEDDSPLGPPSSLEQLSHAVHGFQLRGSAAVRVHCAIYPGIAMIACDHPFIRKPRSAHHADHVENGDELIVLLQRHVDLHRPRTDVIGEGQCPLPLARRLRSTEIGHDGSGVGVGERRGRNLRHIGGALGRNALAVGQIGHRGNPRRGGIAGIAE